MDAFALNALHYIVKPVTPDKARALLRRLSPPPERAVRVLELPCYGKTTRFLLNDISKIISKSRGVEIHSPGQSAAWLPCQFQRAAELLAGEPDFLLLSRGCMVNLSHVQGIDYASGAKAESLPHGRRSARKRRGRVHLVHLPDRRLLEDLQKSGGSSPGRP